MKSKLEIKNLFVYGQKVLEVSPGGGGENMEHHSVRDRQYASGLRYKEVARYNTESWRSGGTLRKWEKPGALAVTWSLASLVQRSRVGR